MSENKNQFEEMLSALRQQRDELALQMHLGAAEAKQEFEATVEKLDKMTEEYQPLKEAVGDSANNVMASMELLGGEILASFERIRKSMQQ